jgi:multidrug efflux pump subunit AcrA (membrane-fusion protein)
MFEVEVGGVMRSVEARGPEALLDGRRFHIDVAMAGHVSSLILDPAGVGPDDRGGPTRSYEVGVVERTAGDLTVYVNGCPVAVRCSRSGRRRGGFGGRPRGDSAGAEVVAGSRQNVVAPMPGRIAKVLVKVGDVVAARQGLVVVEAMKMENELRSPCAGTVTAVPTVEGALVAANAVLVVIDR